MLLLATKGSSKVRRSKTVGDDGESYMKDQINKPNRRTFRGKPHPAFGRRSVMLIFSRLGSEAYTSDKRARLCLRMDEVQNEQVSIEM